jgi:YbbR domain-containing protein
LDLTGYTDPGNYRTVVQIRKTGTALGVDPLEIRVDPLEVTLDLDQRISKLVPVTPNFRGYVQAGYELVSYTLTPTQVVVDGPLNIMGVLSELVTDFIDLEGRMEDFSAQVRVMNRDPLLVIRGDGFTTFQGFVRELIVIRNLEELPIELSALAEEFTAAAEPGRGSVRFEGTQKNLDLYGSSVSLAVDCSQITGEGTYTLPVTAVLASSLTLIRVEPGEITIQVGRAEGDEPR